MSGDPRYEASLGNKVGDPLKVYSIKSKTRRYEVGDLIQFSDRSKTTSYGRILGITWVKEGKCKIEVQLLVSLMELNFDSVTAVFLMHNTSFFKIFRRIPDTCNL